MSLRPRDDDGASTPVLSTLATAITRGAFLYLLVMVPEPEPELAADKTITCCGPRSAWWRW